MRKNLITLSQTRKAQQNTHSIIPCIDFKPGELPAWWCTLIIPALGRLGQQDLKFKASLGYVARPHLKKNKD
jgi:hypothetical protein